MMRKTICFILLLFVAFASCQKYPDGGNNFRARNKILGKKDIVGYTVNGMDSLAFFTDSVLHNCGHPVFRFSHPELTTYEYGIDCDQPYSMHSGSWRILSRKTKNDFLAIGVDDYYDTLMVETLSHTWTIVRLTKKEMWLNRMDDNNKIYELRFKKHEEI